MGAQREQIGRRRIVMGSQKEHKKEGERVGSAQREQIGTRRKS
jgi:hypothetical protein